MSDLSPYALLASALHYPYPSLAKTLQDGLAALPPGSARQALQGFLLVTHPLSLGEWEELYTRTLDLSPAVAPYIGYQMWGDGYARGAFMAALNRAYHAAGFQANGELPDHLGVVMAYLDCGAALPPELVRVFEPALNKMINALRKAEADNPYLQVLEAIAQTVILAPTPAAA